MANVSDKTRQFFEQMYGKTLTDAELLEYKNRLVKFFSLLIEIDRRENVTKTYDEPIK